MYYVATIGFFDGVHNGHRYLLQQLLSYTTTSLHPAVVTFIEHPQVFLRHEPTPLLTTDSERMALLKAEGIEHIQTYSFADVGMLSAKEFMLELYGWGVRKLLLGYNHSFGRDGSTVDYEAIGEEIGIEVIRLHERPGIEHISSSVIRRYLLQGDILRANECLGYHYTLTGVVIKGYGRGHTFGFPTANVSIPQEKLIPVDGVYAVHVVSPIDRKGLMNIGTNPTFNATHRTIEVYLLDYDGDLYGCELRVEFSSYLRPEKHFETPDALYAQIREDLTHI